MGTSGCTAAGNDEGLVRVAGRDGERAGTLTGSWSKASKRMEMTLASAQRHGSVRSRIERGGLRAWAANAAMRADRQRRWRRQRTRDRKRVLDLKSDAGKAELEALCGRANVFVKGFRPGVMTRLGFNYKA